jgi:flagellar basal body-associated protein FliL
MEITSFILGMLTIIGMAAAVLVVLGVVKIYKQSKKVEQLENAMYKEVEQLYRNAEEFNRNFYQQIDNLHRDLDQRIEYMEQRVSRSIEEEKQEVISYIDSRIDKFQSKKGDKQII